MTSEYQVKVTSNTPKLVIVESPYAGEVTRNTAYARKCLRDSLMRGEAPIASHLLYTQPGVLDDNILSERQQGIDAGQAWGAVAHLYAFYTDYGISRGMVYGIERAKAAGVLIEYRSLIPGINKINVR